MQTMLPAGPEGSMESQGRELTRAPRASSAAASRPSEGVSPGDSR